MDCFDLFLYFVFAFFFFFLVFKIFEKFLSCTHKVFKWIIIPRIYILNHAWLFSILNQYTKRVWEVLTVTINRK